jgi:hypothetical protein
MKILYIDVFAQALNPTATLMPLLFRTVAPHTVCYGPGFVSGSELELGIQKFIQKHGPFDVAMFGPNIPILSDIDDPIPSTVKSLRNYAALVDDSALVAAFLADVLGAIAYLPIDLKITSTLNFDYYACSTAQIEKLNALGFCILGPNQQFVGRVAELPDYAREERHFRRKADRICDAYADFVTAHPERVITALHFVAETEFTFRNIWSRPHQISVPGVEYVLRKRALGALSASSISVAPKYIFHLYRLLGRLGFAMFAHYLSLELYHLTFKRGLMDSKIVYTARGGFGMPIRKFFEIPAAGALMVCTPPHGFDAIGFRDGEHYIEAAPEELLDVVATVTKEPERAVRLAEQGQSLVFESHSLRARAEQVHSCIAALLAGRYCGAEWVKGRFHVRNSTPTEARNATAASVVQSGI